MCDSAVENSSCLVHKHVRETRDDELEMECGGCPLGELEEWQPPCSRDVNAFSPTPFWITHRDPLAWRGLPPVGEDMPPYSVCPAPYRWMREEQLRDVVETHQIDLPPPSDHDREQGWVNEPERQRILLNRFWGELEEDRSLIFFYCNHGNPIGDGPARLLVGASRLSALGPQLMFGKTPEYGADHPVWSRRVTHAFPEQGVRLPLQEYLRAGQALDGLVCTMSDDGAKAFSFVSEHVPDDIAVGALERLVQATEKVRRDGLLEGDWETRLAWLDEALGETWVGRGPLPGIGSVFRSLGMERGIAFQRSELSDSSRSRQELWEKVEALLSGRHQPEDEAAFYEGLKRARQRWRALPQERQELLAVLARFELSVDQVDRIGEPRRRHESGIEASEAEIVTNPFLLFEQDEGMAESPRVALDTVDRGLVLDAGRWVGEEGRVPGDDLTRIRATMVAELEGAAEAGDTFLPLDELLDRVEGHFPERRRCDTDVDLVLGNLDFFDESLHVVAEQEEPAYVALPRLREAEQTIAAIAERRCRGELEPAGEEPDWSGRLAEALSTGAAGLSDAAEDRARAEKLDVLKLLYRRRLSVLTGRAGTGKTSVVRAFLDGIQEGEGMQSMLLLAPTGKARVRLTTATGRQAETIHQFLLRNKWLRQDTLAIRRAPGSTQGASTVVVDEASMIPVDLLGVLLRALDLNEVRRLIFVGDPNQLPPIGAGRPFVDLVSWLEAEEERRACIARLHERVRHESVDSRALLLADGYLRETPPPGNDELLASVARAESEGDLAVNFYAGAGELRGALWEAIDEAIESGEEDDHAVFTRSLGGEGPTGEAAESWQVLSPIRIGSGGTEDLNRQIQQRYKAGLLELSRRRKGTFGDEEIVWTDKVMQTANRGRPGWPKRIGLDYVANGEIGVVLGTDRDGKHLDVAFSTQPDVTYRYYGDDAGEELQLAYAITVHKAQGSDFDRVILIVPAQARTLSRELLYTALTRFRQRVTLLVENDVSTLAEYRRPDRSEVALRNSNLFEPQLRPIDSGVPFPNRLIHRASDGTLVRSKSELVVMETLLKMGMSVRYEHRLDSRSGPEDFRLPDFTILFEGEVYYWEHLGMLDVSSYARGWARKRKWYESNGFLDRLITSADGGGEGLRVPEIEERAERRILRREPRGPDEPGFAEA